MIASGKKGRVVDPLKFAGMLWPDVTFYREQVEIIYAVRDCHEVYVPAGNMLGKDFVTAFIVLWFFASRAPCRVVTTSVDHSQLEGVLWGEMRRFIQTSKFPLDSVGGGPLLVNHLHLRKVKGGMIDGLSYCIGRVAAKGEGMLGHHVALTDDEVPRTLFVADEASGVDDVSYERADTWAHRKLVIGNPYECNNFFKKGVKAGDRLPYRKVIRIKAEASPNVRYAMAEMKAGRKPTNRIIVPGVLPYSEYLKRRETWDPVGQCIGLDAEFYEGAEVLMYPPLWLNLAEQYAARLNGSPNRGLKAMGIDTAEGGDKTCFAVVSEKGLDYMEAFKTPDTSVIPGRALMLMREHGVDPSRVMFDAGGGGKEHADRLRAQGYKVQTVAFGESAHPDRKHGINTLEQANLQDETKYVYKNRRAEMYGMLRQALEPVKNASGDLESRFALPAEYVELRQQLGVIPMRWDGEGRMYLLPKRGKSPTSTEETLTDLIGHSPDEADALVLANYGLRRKPVRSVAGAL